MNTKRRKINVIVVVFLFLALGAVLYHAYFSSNVPNPGLDDKFRNFNSEQKTAFIELNAESDPALAWAYLKEGFIINGQVVGNVHDYAHTIGNKAYEKFGINGIKICDPAFAFGCFHGVTEAMLVIEGLESMQSIETECLRIFPSEQSQNYTGCIHGAGHGVYEFEHKNLKKALADCDIITEPYRQYCYDGVFMENSFTPESKIFDEKNPWKFCTDLPLIYHRNCARYQSQVFLGQSGTIDSVSMVGKNCGLGSTILLRETCFESLGYYIAQSTLGVPAEILKSCEKMPNKEGREICIKGGAIETIFQRYGDFKNSADKLCRSLTEPKRTECLENIKNMIAQYVKEN